MENSITTVTKHRKLLFILGPILLLIISAIVYCLNRHKESTDDAYIRAGNIEINANVSGQVIEIDVKDNQLVKRGDLLFQLDARPYQLSVDKAKADLANTYLSIKSLKRSYQEKLTEMQAAKITLEYTQTEWNRQKKLVNVGLSSHIELDKAAHNFQLATQDVKTKEQQAANILAQLDNNAAIDPDQHPIVKAAKATLHQALLNLSYTKIKAPVDGVTANVVKNLQIGDYVQAGKPIFAMISATDVWVEANFKETQLQHIRPGEIAWLHIDAYPKKTWHGHVTSLSPGTGAIFSLLPPENATGNWIKIVQRLPVRIEFDEPHPAFPSGLSVNVTVETTNAPAS